jgi:hypothetical protein
MERYLRDSYRENFVALGGESCSSSREPRSEELRTTLSVKALYKPKLQCISRVDFLRFCNVSANTGIVIVRVNECDMVRKPL